MYCQHTRFINLAIHAHSLLVMNLLQDFSCKIKFYAKGLFSFQNINQQGNGGCI